MEKQFNSASEQMNPDEISIFTGGLSLPQDRPRLNLIYEEPGARLYLVDIFGELTIHAAIEGKITISRLRHFEEVFVETVFALMERGLDRVDTWIETDEQGRFAEFFGFEPTGFMKVLEMSDQPPMKLYELRYTFPAIEDETE